MRVGFGVAAALFALAGLGRTAVAAVLTLQDELAAAAFAFTVALGTAYVSKAGTLVLAPLVTLLPIRRAVRFRPALRYA